MSECTPVITIRPASSAADYRQAASMLHDYAHWITTATGLDPFREQPSFASEIEHLSSVYSATDSVLLMAFEDDLPAATVALRTHPDGTAELKRMYVRPFMRGRGLATRMLDAAITTARERGCRALWLESLSGVMDRAISLYRQAGFVPADSGVTVDVDGMVAMELSLTG